MEILKPKARFAGLTAILLVSILAIVGKLCLGQVADEYEVKAAFLYNFTKFIEWPHTPESSSTPFTICIVGEDPFESTIDRLTSGKTVGGRPLQIRRHKEPADAKQCANAYVSASEKSKAAKLIEITRGTSVLTVGESREFVRSGGMVSLSTDTGRVSVVINAEAAQTGGLKISAKLMTLATVLRP